jgi:ELWxxDGT repeat protein
MIPTSVSKIGKQPAHVIAAALLIGVNMGGAAVAENSGGGSKHRKKRTLAIAAALLIQASTGAANLAKADDAVAFSPIQQATAKLVPRALFAGYDSRGHLNLWVTDGTSAGTRELTVAGSSPRGLFYSYS